MNKSSMLLLVTLLFSFGCAQIQSAGTTKNTATYPSNLTVQRQLVKELDVQQRTSGSFELCSETGVWKCKEVTKKTVITSSSVTSDSPTQEVLNEEWLIQVGAYKTEGAVERAVDALSLMGVGYIQEKAGELTLVRVTGFLTKEDALRGLSDYDDIFKNPFVLKRN